MSVYDAKTLNLVKEIPLPGRALVLKMQNFDISASGGRAYVYIMLPAASVIWVDLKKQVVGGTVEIPGCALVFPWGEQGFSLVRRWFSRKRDDSGIRAGQNNSQQSVF